MFIIGLSIAVIIINSKYKTMPTPGRKTALTVTSIIDAILTFSGLIEVISLGIMIGFFNSDEFRAEVRRAIRYGEIHVSGFSNISSAVDFCINMINICLVIVMIVAIGAAVFGLITTIFGLKSVSDKQLAAAAAAYVPLAPAPYGQPMNNGYGQPMNNGYGQPMNNGYGQPMNNGYGQPMNNGYGQPVNNGYGQPMNNGYNQPVQTGNQVTVTPVASDWRCACGANNPAGQRFCTNCGANNPNA